MLKLERLKNSQKIELRYLPSHKLLERPLQRALLYSFLFHALLFGLFRIQYDDLDDHNLVEPLPIEVAIEKENDTVATILDLEEQEKPLKIPIAKTLFSAPCTFDKESSIFSLIYPKKIKPSPLDSEIHERADLPDERLYPLTLKLSHAIHKLELIDDGSMLFRKKQFSDRTSEFQMTLQHYAITYHVEVTPQTGKITLSSRTQELLDKKLQKVADLLLEQIRFQAFHVPKVEGRVSVIFHAPGDSVEGMLS